MNGETHRQGSIGAGRGALVLALVVALIMGAQAGPAVGRGAATPGATPGPRLLALADVIGALRDLGLTVEDTGETVQHGFFAVPGQIVLVDGADLQVFVYPDAAARERDAATIDPDGSAIGTTMVDWIAPPHFTSAGNLLVLLLTADEDLAADVDLAVTGLVTTATPVASPGATLGATPAGGVTMVAVVDALRAAGIPVEVTGQVVEQGFLGVPGELLLVDGADFQVFVYPTVAAREAISATISPDGGTIGNVSVRWMAPPHFTAAGNVLTLLLTPDEALAERVRAAVERLG